MLDPKPTAIRNNAARALEYCTTIVNHLPQLKREGLKASVSHFFGGDNAERKLNEGVVDYYYRVSVSDGHSVMYVLFVKDLLGLMPTAVLVETRWSKLGRRTGGTRAATGKVAHTCMYTSLLCACTMYKIMCMICTHEHVISKHASAMSYFITTHTKHRKLELPWSP